MSRESFHLLAEMLMFSARNEVISNPCRRHAFLHEKRTFPGQVLHVGQEPKSGGHDADGLCGSAAPQAHCAVV
jgi:hypothetical protein